ncbi:MAG: glucosamine-6-phosphate deaminase [Hominenteromicrobium sp.]
MEQTRFYDSLQVKKYDSRRSMGEKAANDAAKVIVSLLRERGEISMIFAAAPSQNEFLSSLLTHTEIDFTRINAFHMDEYVGLDPNTPQGFGNFLREAIFGKAPFKSVQYIDSQADDPEAECRRYAALLGAAHIDIVCMGIGENAHIAFNDPGEADFDDPLPVKVVHLDETCRNQQVHDGCFAALDQVPRTAITLTVPTLMNADYHFCIVPAESKAQAVRNTLEKEISEAYPASILRKTPRSVLYLDADSSALLAWPETES